MFIAIAVLTALLIGFLAGLVSFKKTNEYCGQHGVTRTCPICNPDLPGRPFCAGDPERLTATGLNGAG